jgi:hypothetical protein
MLVNIIREGSEMTPIKKKLAWWVAPLSLLLISSLFVPASAFAGGLAMSGSFYRQDFEMPQGTSLNTNDIYVTVFNNGTDDFNVMLTTETPTGVELVLSEKDFPLNAGEQKKVTVGVNVSEAAIPGDYTLKVTAEAYKEGEGIKLLGAAGQTAKLTVTGEAASVEIASVTPDGAPIPAMIRLYKKANNQNLSVGYSETGNLKMKVAPGNYLAEAYVAGNKLADKSFSVVADETKKIALEVKTVYFEGFSIVPNYNTETDEMVFAQAVYTVNNLIEAFPEAKVVLKVNKNSTLLDETTLATLAPLEIGRVGLSYNYIPAGGWQKATYTFKLELQIDDQPYTSSKEEKLELGSGGAPSTTGSNINWLLIGGIAGGVIIVVLIIVISMMRRRRYY